MRHETKPYHHASVASSVHSLAAPTASVAAGIYAVFDGIAKFVARCLRAVEVKFRERDARRVLSELDNRTLMDIGICRSEIPYLARRVARARGFDYRVFSQ